jgi:hypothetical protein
MANGQSYGMITVLTYFEEITPVTINLVGNVQVLSVRLLRVLSAGAKEFGKKICVEM